MEKTITKEQIRQLTEKGLKLADSLTEDMNVQQQDSEKYKEKYDNVLKRVKALLDSEK
jgi:myo-inositol-1-phosphate synthase